MDAGTSGTSVTDTFKNISFYTGPIGASDPESEDQSDLQESKDQAGDHPVRLIHS